MFFKNSLAFYVNFGNVKPIFISINYLQLQSRAQTFKSMTKTDENLARDVRVITFRNVMND